MQDISVIGVIPTAVTAEFIPRISPEISLEDLYYWRKRIRPVWKTQNRKIYLVNTGRINPRTQTFIWSLGTVEAAFLVPFRRVFTVHTPSNCGSFMPTESEVLSRFVELFPRPLLRRIAAYALYECKEMRAPGLQVARAVLYRRERFWRLKGFWTEAKNVFR